MDLPSSAGFRPPFDCTPSAEKLNGRDNSLEVVKIKHARASLVVVAALVVLDLSGPAWAIPTDSFVSCWGFDTNVAEIPPIILPTAVTGRSTEQPGQAA